MIYSQFHGQFLEDQWIKQNIQLPEKGIFIDVGADQPILGSNTYHFEKNGWTGLCIDADPRVIDKLKTERTSTIIHSAVSNYDGMIEFELNSLAGISAISAQKNSNSIQIECKTLNTILHQNNINEIDLLDIDVEGHEIEVCEGLDWNKYKPKIIIIEYISPNGGNIMNNIIKYFNKLPYVLIHRTQPNLIFKYEAI